MSYFQKIMPLIIIQSFLSLVLFFFIYGPWPWPVSEENPIYLYLIVCQLTIIISYLSSKHLKQVIKPRINYKFRKNQIFIVFILALFLSLLTLYGRTGSLSFNIFDSLSDLGESYDNTLGGRNAWTEYVRMLFSVSLFMFIPLGLYEFKNLNIKLKYLFVLSLIIHLAIYINMGTNKGLFDIIIFLPWIYLVSKLKKEQKITFKNIISKSFILLILLLIAITFFTQTQLERKGSVGKKAIQNMGIGSLEAVQDKPEFLSQEYYLGYLALTRYLTHGYYAFSQSFVIEYENTFPFGSSMFLSRKAYSLFNTKYFIENGFPGKFDKKTGWSYQEQWHSIYSWLISDFGPFGTLIILFILSRKLAKYWILSISEDNFINFLKFLILIILFFYIPANNQIFQSPESTVVFLTLFFFRPFLNRIQNYSK